ncbi:endolytic transglycosylase MltG [uncultured Ferrimonas sp.]|uniref:endolytic transglycosylase MltG n=1 Tax=uncultured Ferrimonas sp. TaxID=432640 RepID=UPI002605CA5F|nr:endolytic transglycosylase MltG [uncultured Ferrimonas sp.]
MKRLLTRLAVGLGLVFTITAAGTVFVYQQSKQALVSPLGLTSTTEVVIKPGQSVRKLMQQWQQQGWLETDLWLRLALKARPELSALKVGTYRLEPGMTPEQAFTLLGSGIEAQFSITLVEGGTIEQWLTQISQHPRLRQTVATSAQLADKLALDDQNPEGWFYPDTYSFTAGSSDVELLTRAHKRMEQALTKVWEQRQSPLPLATPYELLTLASIIEKETAVAAERKLVASVFVNRLKRGMRLQTDPTVIYGLGDAYQGDITRKHLKTKTPYNTYRIDGLTPTPIANPSLASLQAAADPASSNYLYFVADGNGGHAFNTNLKAHNRAVRAYLRKQKQ